MDDTALNRGLEDVPVAETRLSDIDGEAGRLVVGGLSVDVLAAHKPGRRLETNAEFHTAVLLCDVGIPQELFAATFGVSRVGGWMAHCRERLAGNRLMGPRARHVGATGRTWTPVDDR